MFINGTSGDDSLDGTASSDTIFGGAGNDTLNGLGGADVLSGGGGNDSLNGGDGNDTLIGGENDEADPLTSGYFNGGDHDDLIYGGSSYTLTLIGGAGADTLYGGAAEIQTLSGGDGADSLVGGTNAQSTLSGGMGDDTIIGDAGVSTSSEIYGDEGNDSISGGGSDEYISGGDDNDTISGGAGADTIDGDSGDDSIDGGAGDDSIDGGVGSDFLQGGAGFDTLLGGDGADTLQSNASSSLAGDTGAILDGGSGVDTARIYGDFIEYIFDADDPSAGMNIQSQPAGGGTAMSHELVDIEIVEIKGLGDTPDQTFELSLGGSAGDILSAGLGIDFRVFSGGGDDQLTGGAGNDWLTAGVGADTMTGGAGADEFIFNAYAEIALTADVITDFAAGDFIRFDISGLSFIGTAAFSGAAGEYRFVTSGGQTSVQFDENGDGSADRFILLSNGEFSLRTVTDDSTTLEVAVVAAATPGDDSIRGTVGNDTIDGLAGDDTISGTLGDDTIIGGLGSDVLSGGEGDDSLSGGADADTLSGGEGEDTLTGGAGGDQFTWSSLDEFGASGDVVTDLGADDTISFAAIDQLAGQPGGLDLTWIGDSAFSGAAGEYRYETGGGQTVIEIDVDGDGDADRTVTVTNGEFNLRGTEDGLVTINNAPVAADDAISGDADLTTISGDVFSNNGSGVDSDADGDSLTVVAVNGDAGDVGSEITLASGALLTLSANGDFSYKTNGAFDYLTAGASTTDSFTYMVADGFGGTDQATVTLTIHGVNDSPVAADDAFSVDENSVIFANVLTDNGAGDDSDPDLDTLSVAGVNGSAASVGGQIVLASGALLTLNADGSFAYDPNGAFDYLDTGDSAVDTFVYTVSDGLGGTDTGTVSVTIDGVTPTIMGTSGADVLNGSAGADYMDGLAGDDLLSGAAGNDTILGQDGDDTLRGGDGDDQLYAGGGDDRGEGGAGDDIIRSGPGKDTLLGGDGNDTLGASNKSDLLRGEAGDDLLLGSNGNDRLFGDADDDTLLGGNGRDTLWGGEGADRLVGGNQVDTASYEYASSGVQVRLWAGDGQAGEALGDVLIEIENVFGSAFNDLLSGDDGANRIDGKAGNDIVHGLGGADQLIGGRGADTLTGGADDDTFLFFAGDGADTITDFEGGAGAGDVIRLFGLGADFDSFSEITAAATQVGADTIIDFGGGDMITLRDVSLSTLNADDFLFG